MVDHLRRYYFVPTLAAVLMAGCSTGANRTGSSGDSPANANTAPSISQNATPASTGPPAAETLQPPRQPLLEPEAKPALGPATGKANISEPVAAAMGPVPKLVLPLTDIDFGNVAQGKSLTHNLVIKNAGKANLKIESVSPS